MKESWVRKQYWSSCFITLYVQHQSFPIQMKAMLMELEEKHPQSKRDKFKLHIMIHLFSGWQLIIKNVTFALGFTRFEELGSPNLLPYHLG